MGNDRTACCRCIEILHLSTNAPFCFFRTPFGLKESWFEGITGYILLSKKP